MHCPGSIDELRVCAGTAWFEKSRDVDSTDGVGRESRLEGRDFPIA